MMKMSLFELNLKHKSDLLGFGGDLFTHIGYYAANEFQSKRDRELALKDISDCIKEFNIPKYLVLDWCLVLLNLYRSEPKVVNKINSLIRDWKLYN